MIAVLDLLKEGRHLCTHNSRCLCRATILGVSAPCLELSCPVFLLVNLEDCLSCRILNAKDIRSFLNGETIYYNHLDKSVSYLIWYLIVPAVLKVLLKHLILPPSSQI